MVFQGGVFGPGSWSRSNRIIGVRKGWFAGSHCFMGHGIFEGRFFSTSFAQGEQFAEPGATLYFMDSRSGYQGSYINPPFWVYTVTHWPNPPNPGPTGGWWETFYPSRRHFGNFNAAFMDGHAATCEHDEYYDVAMGSRSIRYWGIYAD